ncbi:hypothetical protein EV702DRAFT_962849, partial [Suillus placidus]
LKPARVAEILRLVKIGNDLLEQQRQKVRDTIAKYADTFTITVKEVYPVSFKTFKLSFPPGATFSTKVNQRPLTPPQ